MSWSELPRSEELSRRRQCGRHDRGHAAWHGAGVSPTGAWVSAGDGFARTALVVGPGGTGCIPGIAAPRPTQETTTQAITSDTTALTAMSTAMCRNGRITCTWRRVRRGGISGGRSSFGSPARASPGSSSWLSSMDFLRPPRRRPHPSKPVWVPQLGTGTPCGAQPATYTFIGRDGTRADIQIIPPIRPGN